MDTKGETNVNSDKEITCTAVVAWAPRQPFSVQQIRIKLPKKFEVRIKILFTSIGHTNLIGRTSSREHFSPAPLIADALYYSTTYGRCFFFVVPSPAKAFNHTPLHATMHTPPPGSGGQDMAPPYDPASDSRRAYQVSLAYPS
ncbi:putative alcohol dehydrogenase [Helianthus anomalus]